MPVEHAKASCRALVPVERIELPTFGLQNRCSTAELNRQTRDERSYLVVDAPLPRGGLRAAAGQIAEMPAKGHGCPGGLAVTPGHPPGHIPGKSPPGPPLETSGIWPGPDAG